MTRADSVKNAENTLNNAYGQLYRSIRSGRGSTPEDLKAVRNETVAPAVRDLDQAIVGSQISQQKKLAEKGAKATDVTNAMATRAAQRVGGGQGKGGKAGTSAPGREKASSDDDDDGDGPADGAAAAPKGAKKAAGDGPTEGEFNLDGSRVEKLIQFEGAKARNAAPPAAKPAAKPAQFEILREESEGSSVTDGTRGEVIEFPGPAKR